MNDIEDWLEKPLAVVGAGLFILGVVIAVAALLGPGGWEVVLAGLGVGVVGAFLFLWTKDRS